MLDDPTGTTEAVWRGLADLGVTGLLVPSEYDGAGMTMVEAGVVARRTRRRAVSRAVAVHRGRRDPRTDAVRGGRHVAAPLFAGIANGSTTAAVGPLDGARPSAVGQGDGVVLRGEIDGVWDVAAADVMLVLADDRDGTGLFAVQTSAPGVEACSQTGIDQTRKRFRRRTRRDARAATCVPRRRMPFEALVDDVIDRLGRRRARRGAGSPADLAVEYAKVRRQFGQPIGAFQAVQHLCVDMYETVELARSGVIHALWAADAADRAERHSAALRAKAFAGRLAAVGDTAIQVFGGIGYTWEHDAHLYLKRLLSWSAFLGGPDRYLVQIGAQFAESVLH